MLVPDLHFAFHCLSLLILLREVVKTFSVSTYLYNYNLAAFNMAAMYGL